MPVADGPAEPDLTPPDSLPSATDEEFAIEAATERIVSLQAALQPTEEAYASFDPRDYSAAGVEEKAIEAEADAVPAFDERYRDAFDGLLFIGALTKRFSWGGHRFVIRTLNVDDLLEATLLIKEYEGTLAAQRAWQSVVCAASVVTIDGKPLAVPLTSSESALAVKWDWVRRHLMPPVVDVIYGQWLDLDATVSEVLISMGEASG
jgi:hypothetical protein